MNDAHPDIDWSDLEHDPAPARGCLVCLCLCACFWIAVGAAVWGWVK